MVTPTNADEDYTRYTMGLSICTSFFFVSRVASEREIFGPISDLACGQDMSVIVRFCYGVRWTLPSADRLVCGDATASLCRHRKVLLAHDVVPVENTPSFVSRERHSDPIGDSGSHHVADRQFGGDHEPALFRPPFLQAVAHDRLKSPTWSPSRWKI